MAVVAGTLTMLAFTGTLRPEIVLVLAALTGLVRPSDMGLRGALIADTMPAATLMPAMGIARTTTDTARIFGALTGAGMFAAIGIGPTYVVITAFYLLGAILTWNAMVPGAVQEKAEHALAGGEARSPTSRSLRRGASCGKAWCWSGTRRGCSPLSGMHSYSISRCFPLTNGLMPYAARDIFHTDQTGLGYLVASVAVGAFIGSIGMTRSGMRIELAQLMIVAAVDLAHPGAGLRADDDARSPASSC